MKKEGFSDLAYDPSECVIHEYIPPNKRESRLVTNRFGGTFLIPAEVPPDEYVDKIVEL